jgi:hypothetical protein
MIHHRHIRLSLYEYVRGELPPGNRAAIDEHLQGCGACRAELEIIRSAVENTPPSGKPSDSLPEAYWTSFSAKIESRLSRDNPLHTRLPLILQNLEIFLAGHRRWALAAGGTALAIGLLMVLLRTGSPSSTPVEVAEGPVQSYTADQRVDEIFRRSKTLLVGLDNLRPATGHPLDLSTERHISRELITETRALRNAPLNRRSAMVVRDLERILIELANTDDRAAMPDVEIIRNGMRQENILFRLRMAEAGRTTSRIVHVRDTRRSGEDG